MPGGLVVVGGGPAGWGAAQAYRRAGATGRVLICANEPDPPYNRPPLSKDFLRGETDEGALPLAAASDYSDLDIELRTGDEVTAVDVAARTVVTRSGRTEQFDRCVLAMGAGPNRLDLPGGDRIRLLRSLQSARELRAAAATAGSAVVIGSGFIGCEAAASLAARGLDVTVISSEAVPQAGRLGDEAAQRISGWLTGLGVRLIGGTEVGAIGERSVTLADGRMVAGDLVLAAVGVRGRSGLADAAGLDVQDGRVVVDEHMRTSAPDVFAAGDLVRAYNGAAGRHLSVEHWGEAERMGEVAGRVAAGETDSWAQVPGFWSEIGPHTLKYAAWGDGFDTVRWSAGEGAAFTVRYGRDRRLVGVLTHQADDDYDSAAELVERAAPFPDDEE